MNKLLNNISWGTYLETFAFIAVAYYAYIGWKYYRPEIRQLINRLTGHKHERNALPTALQYQAEETLQPETTHTELSTDYEQTGSPFQGSTRSLANRLTECIDQAADEPYAPATLTSQLKKILNDYPDIAATTDREAINALVANECEKTGTALLSESEVDTWWSA